MLGNHDAAVVGSDADMNDTARAAIAWTRSQLTPQQCDFLGALPKCKYRPTAFSCMRAPGRRKPGTTSPTSARRAAASAHRSSARRSADTSMFPRSTSQRYGKDCLFHTHRRDRHSAHAAAALARDPRRGGQPRDGIPAASYAILDEERAALTYMRVPYDAAGAAAKVRAAGLPAVLSLRLLAGR